MHQYGSNFNLHLAVVACGSAVFCGETETIGANIAISRAGVKDHYILCNEEDV